MTRKEEQLRKAMLHYLEGSIHPEELEVLNQVVETDPGARRELAELMLQDALLSKVSQESEFFELDDPRPVPTPTPSFRTSRIMKITRRTPVVDAAPTTSQRLAFAAAAIIFTVSVAMAVKFLQPAAPPPDSMPATVMPIAPAAPAAAAPPPPAEPEVEAPAKAVVQTPAEPKAAPDKPKPAAKPKTSTARKDVPDTKPATNVPEGFLSLPSSNKLPPPSSSKPAPKLPPKPPPQNQK